MCEFENVAKYVLLVFFAVFREKYIVIPKFECTKFNSIKLNAILVEKNYDEFVMLLLFFSVCNSAVWYSLVKQQECFTKNYSNYIVIIILHTVKITMCIIYLEGSSPLQCY